jgi:hypothetical protein
MNKEWYSLLPIDEYNTTVQVTSNWIIKEIKKKEKPKLIFIFYSFGRENMTNKDKEKFVMIKMFASIFLEAI